jgi:hypothetical protein
MFVCMFSQSWWEGRWAQPGLVCVELYSPTLPKREFLLKREGVTNEMNLLKKELTDGGMTNEWSQPKQY